MWEDAYTLLCNDGNGVIAKIKSMLENINLGEHYFKTAFLLRESMFLNGVIYSSESWYGVTEEEIGELEKLDNVLLRSIFEVPQSAPVVSLFLESGCVRVRHIIKARRVNFLHQLANLNKEEMEYKFFKCQWDHPSTQDWTEQVKTDLMDLGLPVSLDFVTSKSENAWKDLVKSKVKTFEFSSLMEARKSKTINLNYSRLKMQDYLELKTMNRKEAIVLFKFRTRMSPFAENFKSGNLCTVCPLCLSHVDSQEESFNCVTLKKVLTIRGNYKDIFTNTFTEELVQTLYAIYNYRKEFKE